MILSDLILWLVLSLGLFPASACAYTRQQSCRSALWAETVYSGSVEPDQASTCEGNKHSAAALPQPLRAKIYAKGFKEPRRYLASQADIELT